MKDKRKHEYPWRPIPIKGPPTLTTDDGSVLLWLAWEERPLMGRLIEEDADLIAEFRYSFERDEPRKEIDLGDVLLTFGKSSHRVFRLRLVGALRAKKRHNRDLGSSREIEPLELHSYQKELIAYEAGLQEEEYGARQALMVLSAREALAKLRELQT